MASLIAKITVVMAATLIPHRESTITNANKGSRPRKSELVSTVIYHLELEKSH